MNKILRFFFKFYKKLQLLKMADEATRHIVSEIPMLKIDASRWRAVGAATQGRVSVSYPVCGEQCRY